MRVAPGPYSLAAGGSIVLALHASGGSRFMQELGATAVATVLQGLLSTARGRDAKLSLCRLFGLLTGSQADFEALLVVEFSDSPCSAFTPHPLFVVQAVLPAHPPGLEEAENGAQAADLSFAQVGVPKNLAEPLGRAVAVRRIVWVAVASRLVNPLLWPSSTRVSRRADHCCRRR